MEKQLVPSFLTLGKFMDVSPFDFLYPLTPLPSGIGSSREIIIYGHIYVYHSGAFLRWAYFSYATILVEHI